MRKTEVLLPHSLLSDIDRSGKAPLYHQVAKKFESAIRDGTLPPGSRIENEVSLAERLALSRPTIRRAIQTLVDLGLVVRRRGIGSQVVHGQVTRGLELTSLHDDIAKTGAKPSTQVVHFAHVDATAHIAQRLGVSPGDTVIEVTRVRLADGVPMAILHNWIPESVGNMSPTDLQEKGLYETLRQSGVAPRIGKQKLSARKASAMESTQLDIELGAAVLTSERTAYDAAGTAIEHGEHVYRPDLYSLEFTIVNK